MNASGLDRAPWRGLANGLRGSHVNIESLVQANERALASLHHGDLPRWQAALATLTVKSPCLDPDHPAPRLGAAVDDPEALRAGLMELHPWRKGPLCLGGVAIDSEWRSDWKWDRIRDHLDLDGAHVLDVGCGNGYFGWRMLGAGARCVVGIDPTVLFVMQWLAQARFAGAAHNYVLPLRDTDLPRDVGRFDVVCSMGVLYHRRDPVDHLARLHGWLRTDGQLLLETLVVADDEALHPPGRYARMRNVHEVPAVPRLLGQLESAGFAAPRVLDLSPTTVQEQRSTDWMRFESLDRCLDPVDPRRTIEGHPAPLRAVVLAGGSRP